MDITTAFERKVNVGVKAKAAAKEEFVATGMFHIKTTRIVPLKASVSRMQRSRTIGFRVQMTPVSTYMSACLTYVLVLLMLLCFVIVMNKQSLHDDQESSGDQNNRRKRQRMNSEDGGFSGANPIQSIEPVVLSKLQRACDELQLSSLPKVMTGRENERSEIYNTLRNSIQSQSAGSPIYISGLPGVGKTSILKEIIKSLEAQRAAGELPRFAWIEVNGLHMPKPEVAYSVIWNALQEGEAMVRNSYKGLLAMEHMMSLTYCVLLSLSVASTYKPSSAVRAARARVPRGRPRPPDAADPCGRDGLHACGEEPGALQPA